jgi:uncharacterized protein (TIGR02145 family)
MKQISIQNNYIIALLIFSLVLFFTQGCKKEGETEQIPIIAPPVCELNISGGQTEYKFGDTIFIDCQVIENTSYLNQVKLYLDDKKIHSTREESFSYNLITDSLDAKSYTLKLIASDTRDSIGIDSKEINIRAILPTVVTKEVIAVGSDSATIKCKFISTGGSPTTWGVCYNSSGNPTKDENTFTTTAELFSHKVTGLEKLTTYYVRAWATNNIGTQYGETIEFKTTDESGTFTDFRDDRVYRWVKIGEQIWMAENLAYLPFLSDPINNPTKDSNIWVYGYEGMDVVEARQTQTYKTYGALYSWTMAKNLCPTGWHLPDTNEWNILINYLGGEEVAGGKLKERGTEHWNSPNTGATNESGFTALPGGSFWPKLGVGTGLNIIAVFWNSTDSYSDPTINDDYELSDDNERINLAGGNKKAGGFSVRCVKD